MLPKEFMDVPTASPPGPFSSAPRATRSLRWKNSSRMPVVAALFGSISSAAVLGIGSTLGLAFYPLPAMAQEPAEAAACRKASIETLKQSSGNSPLKDVKLDLDSLTIAKADAEIGGVKVATILIGQAAIQREHSDETHTFLCLLGEKEKVLMTFFTKR
ncbi:hypothetical protein CHELA1G11_13672 [Hyphomicrobiales bacterium]|nr:hypothetical protein CHELA1G2_10643 [Hyphomicrobiales bacterium]CAH1673233.1 hypothetical protein CHELA1G11_13672 [Hyphomicrobiales bacterium]